MCAYILAAMKFELTGFIGTKRFLPGWLPRWWRRGYGRWGRWRRRLSPSDGNRSGDFCRTVAVLPASMALIHDLIVAYTNGCFEEYDDEDEDESEMTRGVGAVIALSIEHFD